MEGGERWREGNGGGRGAVEVSGGGRGAVEGGEDSTQSAEATDLECIDDCNVVTPALSSEIPTHAVSFFSLVL